MHAVFQRRQDLDEREKQNFTYAHNDTSVPERISRTANVNVADFPDVVRDMRLDAFGRNIPVSSDETLAFLRSFKNIEKTDHIEGGRSVPDDSAGSGLWTPGMKQIRSVPTHICGTI